METLEQLSGRVADLYRRLATGTLPTQDIVELPKLFDDTDPIHLANIYKTKQVTEADVLPLRHFTAKHGVILDIGAHWGYTAASMRSAGATSPIISFEALNAHERCLACLRELDDAYDYHIGAVSDAPGEVIMYNLVAHGTPITGINSIGGTTLTEGHAMITAQASRAYHPTVAKMDLKIGVYRTKSRTLDEILAKEKFWVTTAKVAAMKIDVEGHETQVLRGALKTVKKHKPLLMIEYGMAVAGMLQLVSSLGYKQAIRHDDWLEPVDLAPADINNFFYHPDQAAEYARIGLFKIAAKVKRVAKTKSKPVRKVKSGKSAK